MKILELKVEGFRSLKSIDWRPGDLNVVIGPNAGGKSNLLQLLEMISASARGQLSKFVKKRGGMQPLVWDGKADKIKIDLKTYNSDKEQEDLTYRLKMIRIEETGSYCFERDNLKKAIQPATLFDRSIPSFKIFDGEGGVHTLRVENIPQNETVLSIIGPLIPVVGVIGDYKKALASWSIYSELNTGRDALIRQAAITSYEKYVDEDGQNFIAVLHTLYEEDRNFNNEINSAMKAAFGDDFEELSFPPAADGRTQLRVRWKSLKNGQSAANLSDGTLRFLYLLTILANPEPPALIAIDEPETGLHPLMLPIIADYAVEASRKTQVIITTHSPEFLSAFGETQPTTTIVEWHNGQTILRVLSDDKLEYWLKEYTLGEIYRTGELEEMK